MSMKKASAFGATIFALTLTLSTLAVAQQQQEKGRRNQQQQQQQQQQAPAQQNVGPTAQSKEEFDAFMAVQNEQTPAKKVELAEGFIAKYPASDFVMYAQTFRVAAYGQMGKPKEAVAAAEQAIKKCRTTPSAYVPAPPWIACRPKRPAAITRGIPQPNKMQACSKSNVPALKPPTRIGSKGLLF